MEFENITSSVFESDTAKIISLVPSQTELLFDLGLEKNIVGITKFCIHPKHFIKDKIIVGGTKNIKIDKIKALNPDIILCNKEENTKEIVDACEQISKVHVSEIYNLKDSLSLIKLYGDFFSCASKASEIVNEIQLKSDNLIKGLRNANKKSVAYFIWKNPWMVAANNTFIDYLLDLNKFKNVFKDKSRYPEVSLSDLKQKNPEFIFLSSEPYPFKEKHILEIKEYAPNAKIILVDGEMFSWYGSRLIKAFDYFKELQNRI